MSKGALRRRQWAVNALTVLSTLGLLVAIPYAALQLIPHTGATGKSVAEAKVTNAIPLVLTPPEHPQYIGVADDPWHVDDWDKATKSRFDIAMMFTAFSTKNDLKGALQEANKTGRTVMYTWEPWKPVPAIKGVAAQYALQPKYSNAAIARGDLDPYLRKRWARTIAAQPNEVIIRYAHEMNGDWYPWSHDPAAYQAAWRHVWTVFQAGATNVQWVWSVNPNLWHSDAEWYQELEAYWPGSKYVDTIGVTVIDFSHGYEFNSYIPRAYYLHKHFRKPIMLSETNSYFGGRKPFLNQMQRVVANAPWIRSVIWSQAPSRATGILKSQGIKGKNMDWPAKDDPWAARKLGQIVKTAHRADDPKQADSWWIPLYRKMIAKSPPPGTPGAPAPYSGSSTSSGSPDAPTPVGGGGAQSRNWPKLVGVLTDPWHADEWARAAGATPDVAMVFRAWSIRTSLLAELQEAHSRGLTPMITWEPMNPRCRDCQAFPNAAIARGDYDRYIRSFARDVAQVQGPVVIRYAHEFDGDWYPWRKNAGAYVRAWRHIHDLFKAEGAANAVWMWSPNSGLYRDDSHWLSSVEDYWPGADYVDLLGMTTTRYYRWSLYANRLELLHSRFSYPVWLSEIWARGTATQKKNFLAGLEQSFLTTPWLSGAVYSHGYLPVKTNRPETDSLGRVGTELHR